METVDEEFLAAATKFIKKSQSVKQPFFVWYNSTRMHFYTHVKPQSRGISGQGFYADAMVEHDHQVGQLLNLLDELKVSDNTIVIYTTDNGPHYNEWPDGGISPFRGEKNTNWEGGYRVPALVRYPGKIKPNTISNEIMSHLDWIPTLMAAVGEPDIKEKLLQGYPAGANGTTFKVHLDGYNFLPFLSGEANQGPRKEFFYFSDDGLLTGLRYNDWKLVFAEQRAHYFDVWSNPFITLRVPKLFNLRRDPFERADTDSNNYRSWWIKHAFILVPAQSVVGDFLNTFQQYPPRQKPASFNLENVMETMKNSAGGS